MTLEDKISAIPELVGLYKSAKGQYLCRIWTSSETYLSKWRDTPGEAVDEAVRRKGGKR